MQPVNDSGSGGTTIAGLTWPSLPPIRSSFEQQTSSMEAALSEGTVGSGSGLAVRRALLRPSVVTRLRQAEMRS